MGFYFICNFVIISLDKYCIIFSSYQISFFGG